MMHWIWLSCLLISGADGKVPRPVRAVEFLPGNTHVLAAWGDSVVIVSTINGVKSQQFLPGLAQVNALAISLDGKKVAVAHGLPGTKGVLQIHSVNGQSVENKPTWNRDGHTDLIHALAFSPDGKWIASCGYDRVVRILLTANGELVKELKDHSDAVNGLGFSFDGKYFASGGADRAIKIWETQTWKKIHSLNEPTDGVLALAWHPKKYDLAAGGSDQVLRVWEIDNEKAKLKHSAFAHAAGVTKVAWDFEGNRVVSIGEDKVWKIWDASKLSEIAAYSKLSDTPHALAIQSKTNAVAIGRHDGKLDIFDHKDGKIIHKLLPAVLEKPVLQSVSPKYIAAGSKSVIQVLTKNFQFPGRVESQNPLVKVSLLHSDKPENWVLEVASDTLVKPGQSQIVLKNDLGQEITFPLEIDRYPRVAEKEPNESRLTGQTIPFPSTVSGAIQRAGDADWFTLSVKVGQEIAIQIQPEKDNTSFFPILQLVDDQGGLLAETSNGWLAHVCHRDGQVALEVRDREFRGGPNAGTYKLHVGSFPLVTGVFPLGWKKGELVPWHLRGVGLKDSSIRKAMISKDAGEGSRVPLDSLFPGIQTVPGLNVTTSNVPETQFSTDGRLSVPGVGNGWLTKDQPIQVWSFQASKGKRVLLEVEASRLGSSMDSFLEVLSSDGQPVASALLRGVAKTYTIFRDNDSQTGAIRIESWNDLAINDFILLGTELIRIRALPRGPDDDCRFSTSLGKREAFLGTTPTHHYLGQPMHKVTIHPPGAIFPPNGLPQVTLFYQNDDGNNGFGKDSKIIFDPPGDGTWLVRVRDMQGRYGENFAYRLRARYPAPDFHLRVTPQDPKPPLGEGVVMNIEIDRVDDFSVPITVEAEGLPPGFHAPKVLIPAGEISANFALYADPNAKNPIKDQKNWKLIARAKSGLNEIKKEVEMKPPAIGMGGDLLTTTSESSVAIPPGGQGKLLVSIARKNGFSGRVPLDVRGLPHGTRVLDVGLNGILITPRETQRAIVIQVDPWVEPGEYPFVVLSRQEGKNREFAAKTVILKVQTK